MEKQMRAFVFLLLSILAAAVAMPQTASAQGPTYRLGPGDRVRVTVFGEPYLSGEFNVNANGTISLPLIEPVKVQDLTLSQAEELIKQELSEGFMADPKVSVDILNYRPFFIIGEVRNPGSYPYVAEMTVLHAVAIAGGFTPRASKQNIHIQRGRREGIRAQNNSPVQPGDIITVEERFF